MQAADLDHVDRRRDLRARPARSPALHDERASVADTPRAPRQRTRWIVCATDGLRRGMRGSCAVLRRIPAASSWPGRAAWAKRRSRAALAVPRRQGRAARPHRRGRGQERPGRRCSASRRAATTTRSTLAPAAARRRGRACGPGRSRPTTPCSSTSRTTACAGISKRLVSQRRARRGGHRRARASRTSSSSARSSSSSGAATADLIVLDAPAAGHAITFLAVGPRPARRGRRRARSTPRPATCSSC